MTRRSSSSTHHAIEFVGRDQIRSLIEEARHGEAQDVPEEVHRKSRSRETAPIRLQGEGRLSAGEAIELGDRSREAAMCPEIPYELDTLRRTVARLQAELAAAKELIAQLRKELAAALRKRS